MSSDRVYQHFYRVTRHGVSELSDDGGPFGFNITTAIEFDYLLNAYGCDAVIETGCNMGDTTEYLCHAYPHLTIVSCDVVDKYVNFVTNRLARVPNLILEKTDSRDLIERYRNAFQRPMYFLDAHWYEDWPLAREIELIDNGVVCIDDFNIGHPRFGFDSYQGVDCGPEVLLPFKQKIPVYYVNNPNASFEYPCLQMGRLGGKAFYQVGQTVDYMQFCKYFAARKNEAS